MTYIETWIQSPAALAIAKTLLHSLWQAVIAAFVLAACLRFIRTSHLRYAAACAALAVIVAASIGTFLQMEPGSADRFDSQRILYPGFDFANPDGDGLSADASQFLLRNALPWITPVWLIGVLLFSLRQAASCVAAGRMRRRGVCPAPDTWQNRLNAMRSRLKIARPIVLLESCLTQVPLVVGHVRPAILMPLGLLAGLSAEQVELILMHELAHIRRRDYLINMLQTFVESVMFYNPGVWWISKTIRIEREHCCDDIVVNATSSAHAYAAALTALEENRSSRPQPAIAATGGNLVNRIRRVLHLPEPATSPLMPIFAAAVVVVIIAGLVGTQPALPAPAAQSRQQEPLRLWLDEDVLYIISEEERAAFLSLSTNEERSMFIEQFWQRRDPTPGTIENEFKAEHYRRIAYANSNFRTLLPTGFGWKTDRGRTYIQWGPPDELEVHSAAYLRPDGTTQPFPSQIWLYRYIEGIGNRVIIEFADTKGTEDYPRMQDPAGRK